MEVDYQAVIGQLQLENEALRGILKSVEHHTKFEWPDVTGWFTALDPMNRFYIFSGLCLFMVAFVAIVQLWRR